MHIAARYSSIGSHKETAEVCDPLLLDSTVAQHVALAVGSIYSIYAALHENETYLTYAPFQNIDVRGSNVSGPFLQDLEKKSWQGLCMCQASPVSVPGTLLSWTIPFCSTGIST
jgi:hypothetical protein